MAGFLAVALAAQVQVRRYVPGIYWLIVVLVSVGASLGDLLTQTPGNGGFGLDTNATCGLFLAIILGYVGWFSLQQRRESTSRTEAA